jgi:hypothetical protein
LVYDGWGFIEQEDCLLCAAESQTRVAGFWRDPVMEKTPGKSRWI